MVVKPTPAKYKYNLDSNEETSRQLGTSGGREIVSILLTSGGTASAARIYDSKNRNSGPKNKSILIAANAGESTLFTPVQPILFDEGLYIEIEQGQGEGCELFITYN
jgi:hypothetical protein